MDLKARCVAELYQAFKAHKGQLFEVKKHMPNVIKTWGHFTTIPLFRSLDATLQSLLPRNTETIFLFLVLFSHIV
jgi:hypothetical protein